MLVSDFDYDLPPELIARYPTRDRRGSRLLVVDDGIGDLGFSDLPTLLQPGDLLVFNDTRVIKARLHARKASGGKAEILIERIRSPRVALAMIRASKSPRPGTTLRVAGDIEVRVAGRHDDLFELEFPVDLLPLLETHGDVPLPPYLERDADDDDVERYQTVYARAPGAVAAPTAGLHFDAAMLEETLAAGVRHAHVTLHVGAGTFQNLREEQVAANRLHAERVEVSVACVDAVRRTRAGGGRVIAVGTTTVRSLESASARGELQPFAGETELFIVPGYEFRTVDAMITNFHLPQSSLLMLVAAFAGKQRILGAYAHAVREKYRFFSYGDAMFLTPGSRQ